MTMQDPLADMLTRIRNAQIARIDSVTMPSSQTKANIAQVLKDEGYIEDYAVSDLENNKKELTVNLKYFRGKPVIEEIKRISRPGLRQYKGSDDLPTLRGGLGIYIVSTNKGLMSDRAARESGVGGELLCSVF
ncbi:MAG: 30S ribosomal protein S8 [Gammaproteobacteria bacterium]|nr:30S ribosomal protein S8 [Gammaproteobacteria bacterium]